MAYNLAKRIKILKGLTPYEFIRKIRISEPDRFNINSFQHTVGLNSWGANHRNPVKQLNQVYVTSMEVVL